MEMSAKATAGSGRPEWRADDTGMLYERPTKGRIVRAGGRLVERGLQLYEQRPDKDWPLTDRISLP